MVGKISVQPVNICCQRVYTVVKKEHNRCGSIIENLYTFNKIQKKLKNHAWKLIFLLLFAFLVFVLYITNQKPTYKHTDLQVYDKHTLHNEHNSKYHYGVVIDCGSSGSRVFIYYWPPHTGRKEELLNVKQMLDFDGNPVRLKIKPGISSFADNPTNASKSLRQLLRFASHHIPHEKHHETPLHILATAGMRLLSASKRDTILEDLQKNIPKMSNFYFTNSQLDVISGKQEGIYLWIATNYILGRFDHSHDISTTPASTVSHIVRKRTVGTIEIGGASLQIAYEIPQNQTVPSDLGVTINFGCDTHETIHQYQIYVATFLGFGTDFAWKRYVDDLFDKNKETVKAHEPLLNPCLPKDLVDEQNFNNTKFKVTGTGEFDRCLNLISPLLNTSVPCSRPPCSFNGVHQSPIDYDHAEFYGFAEFWYSSDDVLRIGGKYEHEKLAKAAKNFCHTRWSLHKRHYAMGLYPKADDFRFRYQCFKSAWMMSVFHKGLKFPKNYQGLTTVQTIKGKEVQWTLGALLYRSRFMPLRDMKVENVHSAKAQQYGLWIIFHIGFYPILFICSLVIVSLVLIYFRRIRRFSRTSTFYGWSRNLQSKSESCDIRVDI